MITQTDNARSQAEAQLNHIRELLQWFDHANECDRPNTCSWSSATADDLTAHVEDVHNQDRALEAIHETPLSVEVRSGWYRPSDPYDKDRHEAVEYRILLSKPKHDDHKLSCHSRAESHIPCFCGAQFQGPHVRITGKLNQHGEPESARLEYQDWGTPWTEYSWNNIPTVGPVSERIKAIQQVQTDLLRFAGLNLRS